MKDYNPYSDFQIEEMAFCSNGDVDLKVSLVIKEDDIHAVREFIRPALEETLRRKVTLSEALHTCLTYGIHQAYEEATGKPFTLRMDRKPN